MNGTNGIEYILLRSTFNLKYRVIILKAAPRPPRRPIATFNLKYTASSCAKLLLVVVDELAMCCLVCCSVWNVALYRRDMC